MWDSMAEDCDDCECIRSKNIKLNRPMCEGFQDSNPFDDKENVLKSENDVSLYEMSSPTRATCQASPSRCSRQLLRRPLEDHDTNSRDSGYGASFGRDGAKFFKGSSGFLSFENESLLSMDDEFIDFSDMTPPEQNTLPTDFNKLISDALVATDSNKLSPRNFKPPLRRAFSEQCGTPTGSGVRSCLFKVEEDGEIRPFKRSEPPAKPSSPQIKRSRMFLDDNKLPVGRDATAMKENIKFALQRSLTEPDLIGDFSKTFCLPLTAGRHPDLKSITPQTLAMLMKGTFKNSVASFKVIDCRYPYEYEGGHIAGAINIYTKEQCLELFKDFNLPPTGSTLSRHILVFHCEFSSERGPNLSRYLRSVDRMQNQESYPTLIYPEVYLLDGGYKSFYEQFAELCVPVAYTPMLHPEYKNDLRHFRAKSKTWNCDSHRGSVKRLKFPMK